MKLGIMQPYFFPYISYFSLISNCDEFIIFDTPQFMRKGWIERNRIVKSNGGSFYIKAPLIKAPLGTSIIDMRIDDSIEWKNKILAQLSVYKNKAPYYYKISKLVNSCLEGEFDTISNLNENIIRTVCSYLGINTKILVFSEMKLRIEPAKAPDEWALNICKSLNVKSYINSAGGKCFFNAAKYEESGIDLCFIEQPIVEYKQIHSEFEPGLSIIDVMMFNSPDEIMSMILQSSLIPSKNIKSYF